MSDHVFPQGSTIITGGHYTSLPSGGLTKRELFAAMAMHGFAADPEYVVQSVNVMSRAAVKWADSLIAALEGE